MKRILSIDWDFFVNATAAQRYTLFPDGGNENLNKDIQDYIWRIHYTSSPEIKNIGVLEEYCEVLHKMLIRFADKFALRGENPDKRTLVTISHMWIYDYILEHTTEDEEFEVYNIDFHHDMYCYRDSENLVNCGNWVNCLLEKRPNMKYYWVKREDSEDTVIGGDKADCKITTIEEIKDLDFDYFFMCRSDCWSPPHLDPDFEAVVASIQKYMPVSVEEGLTCRVFEPLV